MKSLPRFTRAWNVLQRHMQNLSGRSHPFGSLQILFDEGEIRKELVINIRFET